jgi:hypothetical protein
MAKVDAEALRHYIQARDALKKGDEERAAELFERSVGSPEHNPLIRQNIRNLLDLDKAIGHLVLNLIGDHGPAKEDPHGPGPEAQPGN